MTVLVTGGAGFIGSYVVEELLAGGHEVVVFDKAYRNVVRESKVEWGNLRDVDRIEAALTKWRPNAVIHLAAEVGTGISMKVPLDFVMENSYVTAQLVQQCALAGVETFVYASTVSVYGEGTYWCSGCREFVYPSRSRADLDRGEWDVGRHHCEEELWLTGSREDGPTNPRSVYAATKLEGEHLAFQLGEAAGMRVAAGRLWNVYGARQARDNPYTGVTAMLIGAIERGERFPVYEDGGQRRDYIHASDVAKALTLLLDKGSGVYNVALGVDIPLEMALSIICEAMGTTFEESCEVTGTYREGDIRHVAADIRKIQELGWHANVPPTGGLANLAREIRGV